MAGKFYAVRKGRKKGIFRSWDECRAQVSGISGAEYKSFKTKQEAEDYMGLSIPKIEKNADEEMAIVKAYVDGSYNHATKEFSYGMVILKEEQELEFCEKYKDEELATMRNVAGEIKGSEAAMRYALEHSIDKIMIYHDYEGIAKWCLGLWKTNKEGTKAYKEFYDSIKDRVSVEFVKVKGHSNDKYNDMADKLAKKALGI